MKFLIIISLVLLELVVASEMVLTPGGYRPRECVHIIEEEGAVVHHPTYDQMWIKFANGTIKDLPPCKGAMKPTARQLRGGWLAYAVYNSQETITSFTGRWTVPPPPQSDGQNIYLLLGLENYYYDEQGAYKGETIIQPVLQWGRALTGGGAYWAIASWYVGSNAVYSLAQKVNPNDVIVGNMFLNKNNTWSIQCLDKTTGVSSNLAVVTGSLEPVATVTFEAYGMKNCDDYPNGKVRFSNLAIVDGTKSLSPKWQPVTVDQCEESVTIVDKKTIDIKF